MPSSLLAIILATAVMLLFHLPVATVGKIPQTLISSNRLNMGDLAFLPCNKWQFQLLALLY